MPKLHFLMEGEPGTSGASAPPTTPAAEAPEPPETQAVNWGGLADDSQEDLDAGPTGEPAAPAPSAPAQPVAAPASAPAAPGPTGATGVAAPSSEPVAPVAPAKTDEQLAQERAQQREALENAASAVYDQEMTEEVKTALMTEPEKVLPKLLAKAVLDGANLAIQHVQQMMPQLINQQTTIRSAQEKAVTEFKTAHPDLGAPEHAKAVTAAIKTVKELGLKFTSEADAMAKVASVARTIAGLPAPGAAAAQEDVLAAPVAPHVPVARSRAAGAPGAAPKAGGWDQFLTDDED